MRMTLDPGPLQSAVVRTIVWRGVDAPRMEIARMELGGPALRASGSQIGVAYELRYELDGELLHLEVVGERAVDVRLDGRDFFDLGYSPLFNSLPVLRDGLLLDEASPRDYVMRWISVPELAVTESRQRYEPLGEGRVRYRSGSFVANISFDPDGLVLQYEGLAERVG
jgi:hypothetical protein